MAFRLKAPPLVDPRLIDLMLQSISDQFISPSSRMKVIVTPAEQSTRIQTRFFLYKK